MLVRKRLSEGRSSKLESDLMLVLKSMQLRLQSPKPKWATCSARNNGSSTQMHFTNLSRRQAAWVMS